MQSRLVLEVLMLTLAIACQADAGAHCTDVTSMRISEWHDLTTVDTCHDQDRHSNTQWLALTSATTCVFMNVVMWEHCILED
jgi:hypothetical protein